MSSLITFLNCDPEELHVMVDIETLSTSKDAAITEIGACIVGSQSVSLTVNPVFHSECMDPGGDIDTDTIKWREVNGLPWLTWEELHTPSINDPEHISTVLPRFFTWLVERLELTKRSKLIMWCKGTDFDKVILETAWKYRCYASPLPAIKPQLPWQYNNFHDLRTLLKVFPQFKVSKETVMHDGLQDSIQQASQLVKIAEHITYLDYTNKQTYSENIQLRQEGNSQ